MLTIALHFPRCSGHERKNRLIKSIVYRVAGAFSLPDHKVRVMFYESEFRSDMESNLGDFIHIDVLACPPLVLEDRKILADILKDEVNIFSGTHVDEVSIFIQNTDCDAYFV
ncbi:MAG TPA: hypothetical protein DEA52_00455 [Clostridiaceae bacterium]|nr:hypothetical protein [Clostridiaceae bacterium]